MPVMTESFIHLLSASSKVPSRIQDQNLRFLEMACNVPQSTASQVGKTSLRRAKTCTGWFVAKVPGEVFGGGHSKTCKITLQQAALPSSNLRQRGIQEGRKKVALTPHSLAHMARVAGLGFFAVMRAGWKEVTLGRLSILSFSLAVFQFAKMQKPPCLGSTQGF